MSYMFSRACAVVCGLTILCVCTRHVEAGFVRVEVTPVGQPPAPGPPDFVWSLLPDASGNAQAVLNELFGSDTGDSLTHHFSGITTNDPTLTLTKNVLNGTGVTWVGYSISLDPTEAATFSGTPSSDTFTLESQSAHNLTFGLPSPVGPGDTVSFTFDIDIPSTGPFGFTMSQSPELIPEPATIGLVSLAVLGVGGLLRRRRR